MKMPMGKFKGQPVDAMTTQYLAWLVTRDNIRFKQWPLIKEALRVLRSRDFDGMLDELMVRRLPDHKPTPEQVAKRNAEKAEKLRLLEERRAIEQAQHRAEKKARFQQQQAERCQIVDGSSFARQSRERADLERRLIEARLRAAPDDISDLV